MYEKLTIEGNLVLIPIFFENAKNLDIDKKFLIKLHKQKIDMANEVYFVNKDGYLGEDSINELHYSQAKNKVIKFLE